MKNIFSFLFFRSETPVTTATTTPTTTTTVSTASETFAKETFEEVTESANVDSNNNQVIGTSTNSYIDIKIPMDGTTKGMGRQLQKELKRNYIQLILFGCTIDRANISHFKL